jgi:hypothetical protein
MAPTTRLTAELVWLPGIAPARARQLAEDPAIEVEILSELPPMAAANVAADLSPREHRPYLREVIVDFHADRSDAELLQLLNIERAVIGFPPVTPDLLSEAMPRLIADRVHALIASLTGPPNPGAALLEILSARFATGNLTLVGFLDELVDRFDSLSLPRLRKAETSITTALDHIRKNPASVAEETAVPTAAATDRSSVRRPRQFILARRGHRA